jgi:chromosome segregation ATPase
MEDHHAIAHQEIKNTLREISQIISENRREQDKKLEDFKQDIEQKYLPIALADSRIQLLNATIGTLERKLIDHLAEVERQFAKVEVTHEQDVNRLMKIHSDDIQKLEEKHDRDMEELEKTHLGAADRRWIRTQIAVSIFTGVVGIVIAIVDLILHFH